jgi:hypothetical protein
MIFAPPANLSGYQQEFWRMTTGISAQEWASHFEHCDFDMTMTAVVEPRTKSFSIAASLPRDQEPGKPVTGYPKHPQAYISLMYNLADHEAGLLGANATAKAAQQTGFIGNVLAGFQNYSDRTAKIKTIHSMSVGAGVYTWASYGAVPSELPRTISSLREQWAKLNEKHGDKNPSAAVGDWIERLRKERSHAAFRSIFSEAAGDPRIGQSLKALLMGDARFLEDPAHRYNDSDRQSRRYAMALNDDYRFYPQDPQFQDFVRQRFASLKIGGLGA